MAVMRWFGKSRAAPILAKDEPDEAKILETLVLSVEEMSCTHHRGASATQVERKLRRTFPNCLEIMGLQTFKQLLSHARSAGVRIKYEQEDGQVKYLRMVDEASAG